MPYRLMVYTIILLVAILGLYQSTEHDAQQLKTAQTSTCPPPDPSSDLFSLIEYTQQSTCRPLWTSIQFSALTGTLRLTGVQDS